MERKRIVEKTMFLIPAIFVFAILSCCDVSGEGMKGNLIIQNGHLTGAETVAFSDDGKYLASTGSDDTIRIWLPETGELLRSFNLLTIVKPDRHHYTSHIPISFAPDDKILTIGFGNLVIFWNVETNDIVRNITVGNNDENGQITSIAFTPKWTICTYVINGVSRLFNLETQNIMNEFDGIVSAVSKDVVKIAVLKNGDKEIESVVEIRTKPKWNILYGFPGTGPVAFSPNGKLVAIGSDHDASINLWDLDTGERITIIEGHSHHANAIAFTPDSKKLISVSGSPLSSLSLDHPIKIWDVKTGNLLYAPDGHDFPQDIAVSPNGMIFASTGGSFSSLSSGINVWSVVTGSLIYSLETRTYPINTIAFSSDSKYLYFKSWDKKVRRWKLTSEGIEQKKEVLFKEENSPVQYINELLIDLFNRFYFVKIISEVTRQYIATSLKRIEEVGWKGRSYEFAMNNEGSLIAEEDEHIINIINTETGNIVQELKTQDSFLYDMIFSPRGQYLAFDNCDISSLCLWNLKSEETEGVKVNEGYYRALTFSPNDSFLALSKNLTDNTAVVYDIQAGRVLNTFKPYSSMIHAVAFSPDEKYFAVVSGNGNTLLYPDENNSIEIWNVNSGEKWRDLEGHQDTVNTIAYSPNGKLLASGSDDTTIKLWNAMTGELILTLIAFEDNRWFVLSPSGQFDCSDCDSNDQNGTMKYIRWRSGNTLISPNKIYKQLYTQNLLYKWVNSYEK